MTEIPESDLVILNEQWQQNPEKFLNEAENRDIEYHILIKYLKNINLLYHENIEKQQIFEELQSNLNENIQIINKKNEVCQDRISEDKQRIEKLINESKIDKGKIKSFFDRLQESNDQEISKKKIKSLEEKIEELKKVKKKIDQSENTFTQLENIDYLQRNKNLIIIATEILRRLETVELDSLSRNDINTINQSMILSNNSISNLPVVSRSFPNIILYSSLFIPILGIFIYYLK